MGSFIVHGMHQFCGAMTLSSSNYLNVPFLQWLNVTNTVWWQDFPCRSVPDYLSLFLESPCEEVNGDSKSDFSAQLAGFMATLLADVPSQAHWISELSKYNFTGALAHLITSVPGIHSPRSPYISNSKYFLSVSS